MGQHRAGTMILSHLAWKDNNGLKLTEYSGSTKSLLSGRWGHMWGIFQEPRALSASVKEVSNLGCYHLNQGKWLFRLYVAFMLFPDFSTLDFLSIFWDTARLKALFLKSCLALLFVSFPRHFKWVPEHPSSNGLDTILCNTLYTCFYGASPLPSCSPTYLHSSPN